MGLFDFDSPYSSRADQEASLDSIFAELRAGRKTVKQNTVVRRKDDADLQKQAADPDTEESVLSVLAYHSDLGIRWKALQNPSLNQKVAETLYETSDEADKQKLLTNPNIPSHILLYNLHYGQRLEYVALNPQTPADALQELSWHASLDVRHSVAANPNTPAETLTWLSKTTTATMLENLLNNPSLPDEAILQLFAHYGTTIIRSANIKQLEVGLPSILTQLTSSDITYLNEKKLAPHIQQLVSIHGQKTAPTGPQR